MLDNNVRVIVASLAGDVGTIALDSKGFPFFPPHFVFLARNVFSHPCSNASEPRDSLFHAFGVIGSLTGGRAGAGIALNPPPQNDRMAGPEIVWEFSALLSISSQYTLVTPPSGGRRPMRPWSPRYSGGCFFRALDPAPDRLSHPAF